MKKTCILLCSLFMMTGCFDKTEKQVICIGYANGTSITSVLSATGDTVRSEIYEERTDLEQHGYKNGNYSEEEKEEIIHIIRNKKYASISLDALQGITYTYTLEDNYFVFTLTVNYDEAKIEDLQKLHFIENNNILNLGVSLKKTLNGYKEQGMDCK